ncbi:MAG: PssD/Cps14F family polysaccharide biosynthesis glycosyltransferase [Longibaculum muris]|uniref:Oligosaccharide biosynthesis protein Alg14 n=1 Tax=Longibaculum muris TaxID=1796628 RepID=A0A4R3Z878_9FIRM|nr:PssD/Cps14F family polysaccharide biosynthesis glycosyltransferase [Longibaculum muris]KXU41369.1 oligosaccharide biosynthesis protein Alg14 like protein [Candidatus Stoquefichus sp. KLE1796]MBS5371303.1 polysaccharide biosynthesis protein [Coprobacillus cateniformis]MCR1886883.1 UDP-N-acetylglucosamine transferase subunit ALG14 [Longibaculum muris]MED9812380.1 PssD/Cps14F family polysaccharide biosynthesis glycosyltransferase [Longibaculum muris]TCW02914.1 oligosaccharide biosynthesis prot
MKKICFAASSGGHFEQLMMLYPLMKKNNSFIITEKAKYDVNTKNIKTYYLRQTNRNELMLIINLLINLLKSIYIYYKEKPDIVICTGVLSMIPICLIAKINRKKLIYIESFAKVNSPTLSGKLLYKFADVFYVQWESMIDIYPKARFIGYIY